MKKNYLAWSLAALALAGCSQNDIMETNPDAHSAIGFGVYTGVQTKGLITDNSTTDGTSVNGLKATGKGFGIMAYLTTGADYSATATKATFMNNQQVTWDTGASSSWKYTPVKYWPNNTTDRISFFAYAPYSTSGSNGITLTDATNSANPKLGFTLQTEQKKLVDLVVSESTKTATGTENRTSTSSGNAVTFGFKHVLTRVTMKAQTDKNINDNAQTKVYITGVELVSTNKLAKKATFDMYTHKWELPANGASNYNDSYVLANGASTATGVLNMATASSYGDYTKSSIEITETQKSLFIPNHYLFLIPVGNNGGGITSTGDVKVKITYDIVTLPSAGAGKAAVSSDTKEVDIASGVLAQGKAYSLNFTVGLKEIKVTVTENFDWDTSNGDQPLTVN